MPLLLVARVDLLTGKESDLRDQAGVRELAEAVRSEEAVYLGFSSKLVLPITWYLPCDIGAKESTTLAG